MVTFLHEAYLERDPDPVLTLEPFERFEESNATIDEYASIIAEADEDGILRARVLLPNEEEITSTVEPSRLLFGVDREAYKLALNACRDAAASKLSGRGYRMRDAVLAVEAGLSVGVSPGFTVRPASVIPNAEELVPEPGNLGVSIRAINQTVLYELSIVARPAYGDTEVDLRADELLAADSILREIKPGVGTLWL